MNKSTLEFQFWNSKVTPSDPGNGSLKYFIASFISFQRMTGMISSFIMESNFDLAKLPWISAVETGSVLPGLQLGCGNNSKISLMEKWK